MGTSKAAGAGREKSGRVKSSRDEAGVERRSITRNRKAHFEYEILDTVEAGLVLVGPEVKALREGNANLSDAYAVIRRGEVWLISTHIGAYDNAARANVEPRRERKCLLHRAEIARLDSKLRERGFTLVPLELYFKGGRVKVQLGLARGKRRHDKRESIRQREQDREMQRALRGRSGRR